MAAFIAMTSWQGEFTDKYFDRPPAGPAKFGRPDGGLIGGEFGYAGQPEAFAVRLHEVLDRPGAA